MGTRHETSLYDADFNVLPFRLDLCRHDDKRKFLTKRSTDCDSDRSALWFNAIFTTERCDRLQISADDRAAIVIKRVLFNHWRERLRLRMNQARFDFALRLLFCNAYLAQRYV